MVPASCCRAIARIGTPHDFFLFPCGSFREDESSLVLPLRRGCLTPETLPTVFSVGWSQSFAVRERVALGQDRFRRGFGHECDCRKPKPRHQASGDVAGSQSSGDALVINAVFQPSFVPSIMSANALVSVTKSGSSLIVPSAKSFP